MSSPASSSIVHSSSFSSLFKPRTMKDMSDGQPRVSRSAFLGYELPSSLRSPALSADYDGSMSLDDFSYSPPPSPTLKSFIPRFESPYISYVSTDTPSFLNESLPSTVSSPHIVHTPMPYTTTRDPRPDTAMLVGLGISGLFMQNGSLFDGMGALPRRDECTELGFFMDEADHAGGCGKNEGKGYPEHEEDAWRKGITACGTARVFDSYGDQAPQCPLYSSTLFWSPPAASSPFKSSTHNKGLLPVEPETEDLFFTRSPTANTLPSGLHTSTERLEISRAVVSSWFRSVQSPGSEELEERFASVL